MYLGLGTIVPVWLEDLAGCFCGAGNSEIEKVQVAVVVVRDLFRYFAKYSLKATSHVRC